MNYRELHVQNLLKSGEKRKRNKERKRQHVRDCRAGRKEGIAGSRDL